MREWHGGWFASAFRELPRCAMPFNGGTGRLSALVRHVKFRMQGSLGLDERRCARWLAKWSPVYQPPIRKAS